MFKFRKHEIDPFPVHDRVVFRNIDKAMEMKVKADASLLVVNLNKARKRISALTDDTPEEDKKEAAVFFAEAMFGHEQAVKMLDFYDNDPLAVIMACGKYFQERLSKIITKAQKQK